MKKLLLAISVLMLVSACTTPMTTLINPKTEQVVTCGGSATGSLVGGYVGYKIQESNDGKCIQNYKNLGFEVKSVNN